MANTGVDGRDLPSGDLVLEALRSIGPYFRKTQGQLKEGGIVMTLNPGHKIDRKFQDADKKLVEACAIAGIEVVYSAEDDGRTTPVYNPKYPEKGFMAAVNQLLELSEESKIVSTSKGAPRHIVIHGEENLRKLALLGIKFEGYENHLSATEKLRVDTIVEGGRTLGGRFSDPRQKTGDSWSDKATPGD